MHTDCTVPVGIEGSWYHCSCGKKWQKFTLPSGERAWRQMADVGVVYERERKGPRPPNVKIEHVCAVPVPDMIAGIAWLCQECNQAWQLDAFMRPRMVPGDNEGNVPAGKAVSVWADQAMVAAEPHEGTSPKCYLLGATSDPLGELASMNAIYTGCVVRSLAEVSDLDRQDAWEEVMKTRIQTPLEVIRFHFLFENVTRAFTHQLVRTRHATYCLSGDTKIHTETKRRRYTLAEIWSKWGTDNGIKQLKIRTVTDEGMIITDRIKNIIRSGIKQVWELQTHDGRTIKASADHLFWRPNGSWSRLGDLIVGDEVISNGYELATDELWLKQQVANGMSTKQIAQLANCSDSHIKKYRRKFGIAGEGGIPLGYVHSSKSKANMRNAPRSSWTEEAKAHFSQWCRDNRTKDPESWQGVDPGHRIAQYLYRHKLKGGCSWCGGLATQLAHIDGNPDNNNNGNVQPMCEPCHKAMDNGTYPRKTYSAEITSIEYVGEEMTYDIEMDGEYSRFVANGLVVHNSQESLRFAVVEDLANAVATPPSLANAASDDMSKEVWDKAVVEIGRAYNLLVNTGMPAEDARGLLPTNVLTRIHVAIDLRNLIQLAGNRLCSQAQAEWKMAMSQMVRAIRGYGDQRPDGWQFQKISEIFRPICYLTGKCEFKSKMDRPCRIRDDVDQLEADGVPVSDWDDHIDPARWLADPNVARPL